MSPDRLRLDAALAERGLAPSRARARDAILRGHVSVDGRPATKPSQTVGSNARIVVEDPAGGYVARSALKLLAALDHFGLDVSGRSALDVGASTGGFTQVLLERGARHVVAIDVGHDQLHPQIAADPRVHPLEGLNARDLSREDLAGHAIDFIACDVSFISLTLALPLALALAEPGASGAFLIKPQFEAGRDAIGKNGLLRDPGEGARVAERLAAWLGTQPDWTATDPIPSPLPGGDGNMEYLVAGHKG